MMWAALIVGFALGVSVAALLVTVTYQWHRHVKQWDA